MVGTLLDTNLTTISNKINIQLMKDSEGFGLSIFGDGATTLRTPFTNMLAAGVHDEAGLLDIDDCTGHFSKGFKNGAE